MGADERRRSSGRQNRDRNPPYAFACFGFKRCLQVGIQLVRTPRVGSVKLRPDEAFVSEALVHFFGGPEIVSASDGDDPPDFYITFNNRSVAVEVTRLTPIAIGPDGSIENRFSQDILGLRITNELETTIGTHLPEQVSLLVGIDVPIARQSRFLRGMQSWIEELIPTLTPGMEFATIVAGSKVAISVMPRETTRRRIIGYVVNKRTSPNILMNAQFIIENRIKSKIATCGSIARTLPIWLAMLNDFWLADAETYQLAIRDMRFEECFERLFVVSDVGLVTELSF
ncbi:MAG: hypothetical protein ACKVOI_08510 [Dongiaceae bacterium]